MTLTLVHDPHAVLDYRWDWTAWLDTAETITAQTVTVPTGLTISTASALDVTLKIVTVWLSGGTAHTSYPVVCHITTSAGRQDDRTINVLAQNR